MEKKKLFSTKVSKNTVVKDPTEVEDYLKNHILQFNGQKNKILDKINELYDMNEATFSLRHQLNKRNQELHEVKSTNSNLQFALIQQQDQNLSLLKENDELRLRLLDYQKKVQILLSYANIPKDFPILSLVAGVKPDFIVKKKLPKKCKENENKNSQNSCECNRQSSAICNVCGKLVKNPSDSDDISSSENHKSYNDLPKTTHSKTYSRQKSKYSILVENKSKLKTSSDFIDDIEQANLVVQSLQTQLHEIKYSYDQHIDLLQQDTKLQQQEHKVHIENYTEEYEYYNTYVKNLHLVLYKYLYEEVCSQHTGTNYLSDLYKYMICVQKCKQLLGNKFPNCIKSYRSIEPSSSDYETKLETYVSKVDSLKRQLQHAQETNTHFSLALSSAKIKQQDNLIAMNERVDLYRRKYEELFERKNKESKHYRSQIDNLISEVNQMLEER